ncbi:MAG TPA: hypothetical protein VEF76_06320 [Patescibacteria group bacterium]|nr:hypothetical protein [Patescibacteria group bacterium]
MAEDAATLLALADSYCAAAEHLRGIGRKMDAVSWHPYRFNALQAIEHYLTAFLLIKGVAPDDARALQHSFKSRMKIADEKGLVLTKRTRAHIDSLDLSRDYLMSRYNPAAQWTSHISRVDATLHELAKKVGAASSS